MNGLSGSDISTGWKPVSHEDENVTPPEETAPGLQSGPEKPEQAPDSGAIMEQTLPEILKRLDEIRQEIISLRQLVTDMEFCEPSRDMLRRRRKLRKRYFFKND
ncbi:MAG TPA: hypothetical protein PLD49_03320 [Thermoclostridium caenicola]|uniref:Uncharacterized protein n=1 Tax=Thermoclostridium caenicola TaxID=659425 RepID=A0A1M6EVN7_9FIRM|nr:hypothetical protein [Thermoclostridium caenicola]SHI89470.1 hypothetical protein SAMN05444373_10148 [Thermoclostridium caenicola]HOK42675.1 hypothetical protein [Thermoclostridium caenicola]HOL83872.1 hypothetical protein [Thermoclostridium caenicola]HPO75723.1 hypothetical protein [Thermoclostridium caenicola]HPU22184.1 hypothetical protein [Thermoclostridium caenicola]